MTTSKAELIQYGDRKFSEKWVKATDAEEQRRVLSELVTFKKLDEIKLLIELGVNPNVHNRNNKFRGNVSFVRNTRNNSIFSPMIKLFFELQSNGKIGMWQNYY